MNKQSKATIAILIIIIVGLLGFILMKSQDKGALVQSEEVGQLMIQEPVRIGAILPLSGSKAAAGEETRDGLMLAALEINRDGGIGGRSIEITLEDSLGTAEGAVLAMQNLLQEGVGIFIAGILSSEATPLIPIAQEEKVFLFSPTASTSELLTGGEYVFKMREGNDMHARGIVGAMKSLEKKRVAAIYSSTEFCEDSLGFIRQELEAQGIELLIGEAYGSEDTDFRTQIAKIRHENPDSIYACGYYQDLSLVLKQAREMGLDSQFFSVSTIQNPVLFDIAGEAAEGVVYTVSPLYCADAGGFCENLKAEGFQTEPSYRSAYLYDALHIIAQAIERGQSDDPEDLKDALLETNFKGATGITKFDQEGNSIKDVVVRQVKDGEFVKFEN